MNLMRLIFFIIILLNSILSFGQNEFDEKILLTIDSTSINTHNIIFNFFNEVKLKIKVGEKNINGYTIENKEKNLNIETIYSPVIFEEKRKTNRCVTTLFRNNIDSTIYRKYYCDILAVEKDFNYEFLIIDSIILELNYYTLNEDTDDNVKSDFIDIKILNMDYFPLYGYIADLSNKTISFGMYKRVKRINNSYEDPNEPEVIFYQIIESSADKYGIWKTINFKNQIVKLEDFKYENIIEIK